MPIESALAGVSGVKTIRSKSVLDLSSVVLILNAAADRMEARQHVQERLGTVSSQLPVSAHPPVMLAPLSSLSRLMKIGITLPTRSQTEMTTIVRWTVRPRLMAVPGVANVAIWGQRDKQLQVLVDPERLQANHVSLDEVLSSVRHGVSLETGGFVDTANQRLAVAHSPVVTSAADLAGLVLTRRMGAPLRIGDVATVVQGHQAPIGDAIINDVPGLLLIVEKQLGANTLQVTRAVEQALATLKPALGDLQVDPTIFRPATFIEMSLANLNQALLIGCVLVIVVLMFFLADWRTALISSVAIPLSLLAAAMVLRYRGGTIDTMILAGLVIALGEVVDDAVIDVENIVRRLRQNRVAETPRPAIAVVFEASIEVRSAVVFGSLIVMLVFLPVFMLEGLSGAFFRPLATAYVLAILASLFVALTITPALCLVMLPNHLDPQVDYDATVAKVQAVVDGYPGLYRDLLTYLRERIKEVLTGASATVVVRIEGPDLGRLQAHAVAVRRAVTTVVHGSKAGEFFEDQRFFDVVVWGVPEARGSIDAVRAIRLPVPGGSTVPLVAVADVTVAPVQNEITRENGARRIDVTCNVSGRDLGSVARDIQTQLATLDLGAGYHAEVLGEYAARAASSRSLMMWGGVALAGILLILLTDFGTVRLTALVFLTLPFALVGAIAAAFLSGGVLSLGSLVGLVTVIGIAARNGIMLISHYRHMQLGEGVPFGRDLVLRGAVERLAPILMTALATGPALVPIALSGDKAGHEIEHPMAVVILGGLVTSTLLNLFLLPPLYLRCGRQEKADEQPAW